MFYFNCYFQSNGIKIGPHNSAASPSPMGGGSGNQQSGGCC